MNYKDIVESVLLTEEEISDRVKSLGEAITKDYQGQTIIVIGILRGAAIFLADLVRHIEVKVELEFMSVSSYGDSTQSSGEVQIIKDLDSSIEDKHVLIVEDIVDTGNTLSYLVNLMKIRGAQSVKVCSLLDKPERRLVRDLTIDYKGFDIPDEFVVGYGMDYAQQYRHLPFIGILKREVYE